MPATGPSNASEAIENLRLDEDRHRLKTRFRGLDRTEWRFTLALAAYDLTRMPNLLANELGS